MIKEQQIRKNKSIEILKEKNIPYLESLPVIESKDSVRIRSAEEIAIRAIVCLLVIQVAYDIMNDVEDIEYSKKFMWSILEKYNVQNDLTENEKNIMFGNVSEQQAINMTWKYEADWVLFWALGFVEKLEFPNKICDTEYMITTLQNKNSFDEFLQSARLRDISEILDEADLIYRYDWACVEARINNQVNPAELNSSVVLERHRALNWLIDAYQEDDWDNVQTHT